MSGTPWTDADVEYLRTHYNKDCAEHLGRTVTAINWKRRKERIPSPPRRDLWTQEEIKFLIKNAEKMSIHEIAEHLGRTDSAVRVKYDDIHVSHHDPAYFWTKELEETVAEMSQRGRTLTEISVKIGRTPEAIKQRCYILGIVFHTVRPDWRED